MNWTQEEAIKLCIEIEQWCPDYGARVALTGGCLYKDGPRKDLDVMFYNKTSGNPPDYHLPINWQGILSRLGTLGWNLMDKYPDKGRWCIRMTHSSGRKMDLFFPDFKGGYYP